MFTRVQANSRCNCLTGMRESEKGSGNIRGDLKGTGEGPGEERRGERRDSQLSGLRRIPLIS